MEYIEDLTKLFASSIVLNTYDEKIARSFADQCYAGNPFTEKQGLIVVRLLKKYRRQFFHAGVIDIESQIENPRFKYPFRVVDKRKIAEIVKIGEDQVKHLCLQFPYENEIVAKIKRGQDAISSAEWDSENKRWVLGLTEENLEFLVNFLIPRNFEVSDELVDLVAQHEQIKQDFENYIPTLTKEDGVYKFKNFVKKLEFSTLFEAVIAARTYHVPIFSDEVYAEINEMVIESELKEIFSKIESRQFFMKVSDHKKSKIVEISKVFDGTTAIFVNDNITASALEQWVLSLIECGISLDTVAVLFRQKNEENGQEFNNIVKKYELNKPVSDDLRWIFLGSKYPKSLIKTNIRPDICILENKMVSAHYTLQSITKNSMMNIYYGDYAPKESGIVVM